MGTISLPCVLTAASGAHNRYGQRWQPSLVQKPLLQHLGGKTPKSGHGAARQLLPSMQEQR